MTLLPAASSTTANVRSAPKAAIREMDVLQRTRRCFRTAISQLLAVGVELFSRLTGFRA
jgi:hypothetical protein